METSIQKQLETDLQNLRAALACSPVEAVEVEKILQSMEADLQALRAEMTVVRPDSYE